MGYIITTFSSQDAGAMFEMFFGYSLWLTFINDSIIQLNFILKLS